MMTRAVSKTSELSGKYLISSGGHILNLGKIFATFTKTEIRNEILVCSEGGGLIIPVPKVI